MSLPLGRRSWSSRKDGAHWPLAAMPSWDLGLWAYRPVHCRLPLLSKSSEYYLCKTWELFENWNDMRAAWENEEAGTGSCCYEKRLPINAELHTDCGKRGFHSLSWICPVFTSVLHPGTWDRQREPYWADDILCLLLIGTQPSEFLGPNNTSPQRTKISAVLVLLQYPSSSLKNCQSSTNLCCNQNEVLSLLSKFC